MATEAQTEAMTLYLAILEEAKVRIDCINTALSGKTNLPERSAIEFCYLQLRMLCELTAIGCLVLHGDIEGTQAIRKVWAADEIMKRLEKLHPDFYPHPVLFTFPEPGRVHLEKVEEGFLKREDLIKLVGLTGDILHRGSLKNLLTPNKMLLQGFDGVRDWGQKLVTLLSQHRIGLLGGNAHIVCALTDARGAVTVSFAASPLS
jgi:hypothetical protein